MKKSFGCYLQQPSKMASPNYERYCSLNDDGMWTANVPIRFTSFLLNQNKNRSLGNYPSKEDAVIAIKTFFTKQDKRQIPAGDYVMIWNRAEQDLDLAVELRFKAMADDLECKHAENIISLKKKIETLQTQVKYWQYGVHAQY